MDRRRWRSTMSGLAMLGMMVGCGGGGDSGSGQVDRDEAAEQADQADRVTSSVPADPTTTTTLATTTTAAPQVAYEVDGSGTALVSYWMSDNRQQDREVTLPWSEDQADEPSRLSMLVILGGAQGDVTCRIRRGDEVLAEATLSATAGPMLACDYPPSGLPPVTYPSTGL